MEKEPEIIERSPRLTAVSNTADQSLHVHEASETVTRNMSRSPAPLSVSENLEKPPQNDPGHQETESRTGTPSPIPPDQTEEAEDWYQKYNQQREEFLVELEKVNSLETAKKNFRDEATAWKTKCVELEERLEEEQDLHHRTRLKVQHKQQEVGNLIGLLNDANNKLGSAINPSQVRHQLDDSAIVSRVKALRISIRNFTEEFGEIDAVDGSDAQSSYTLFKRYLWISNDSLINYLKSPPARPKLLRPFIWAFLYEEVFDKFSWAPPDVGNALKTLRELIEPSPREFSDEETKVERKAIMWRADTANLVLEKLKGSPGEFGESQKNFLSLKAQELSRLLEPLVFRDQQTLHSPLVKLLEESLELDLVLSQQVAIWSWRVPDEVPCEFNKEIHASTHRRQHGKRYEISFVRAPAILKRGKSSGDEEDFLDEYVHVPMEVEIEAVREESKDPQSTGKKKGFLIGFEIKSK